MRLFNKFMEGYEKFMAFMASDEVGVILIVLVSIFILRWLYEIIQYNI